MSLFDFGKKKEEIIVVFDIGSASVGGMIIKTKPESDPEIIASARNPVNFLFDVNFPAFWRSARNAVKKTADRLCKLSPVKPDKVLCVFSSPWFISQTRIISVRKGEPFEISGDFFNKLLDDEIKELKKKRRFRPPAPASGRPGEASASDSDFELMESERMKTCLNGYPSENPFGKKAKTFKAYVHMSFGSGEVIREMEKIISEKLGESRVFFRTLPFVTFGVLEKIIKPEAGYLFADIGGEVSDVSLVRKGAIEEVVSFPLGRNAVVREVASRFKTTIKEADSLIERFRSRRAGASDSKEVSLIAERFAGKWREFLRKALVEISSDAPLPRDFFIVGNGIDGLGFIESVKDPSFSVFTVLGKPFNVRRILPEGLKHYFRFERSFEKDKDGLLMLESLFAAEIL